MKKTTKTTLWRRGTLLLMGCLMGSAGAAQQWTGTWATAIEFSGGGDMPQTTTLTDCAVRQTVHVSLGGDVLRLSLSNAFSEQAVEIRSAYVANALTGSDIDARTARYLTFGGRRNVTIAAGQSVQSDAFSYALQPLQRLSITINYGATPTDATGHRGSRTTSYIMRGESRPKRPFATIETVEHWYNIAAIDVQASPATDCIALLGNSITDGRGTTTDQQNRWSDVLAESLGGASGVLNLGIGGNCVLQGGLGQPAVSRFARDILGQQGVKRLVICEGINDIGTSADSEHTARRLIDAYQDFIAQARRAGMKVYLGTITPLGNTDYWSHFHEAARQTVNDWIRSTDLIDGVIDFDHLILDPDRPTQLRPDYQFDWLHPNADGYRAMGQYAASILGTIPE